MHTKLLIAAFAITLTACGTSAPSRARMSFNDLNNYRIDCTRKEEQLEFLRSQFPSRAEQRAARLRMSGLGGMAISAANGTLDDDDNVNSGATTAVLRDLIRDLENCRQPTQKELAKQKQGCTYLNENMNAGASAGAMCRQNGQPPKTRWEALVDD